MDTLVYIALFSPLVGAVFSTIFGAKEKCLFVGIFASLATFASFVASFVLLFKVIAGGAFNVVLFDWISSGHLSVQFGFLVDEVSVVMMNTVAFVSTCVHVYSIGYMEHDKGFNRYFASLSAFVFSMMILVMSDNFLGLFIGWEGVGLCSWMLIGFWYHKDSASWAANEAFIMNRISDLGMLLGIFLIFWQTGSLTYSEVFANISLVDLNVVVFIGILLFIGAMGKSAQFPMHTWLADAMEGPTPVSALIHAATMVTAGVYLVIRANPIYDLIPEVGLFIASLGAFVAIFAASMALVNNDLKRIIAYSTLSQLGYMFVAAGLGAYWIALFHLVTHAFFKSLLFLGAGNVMHAMDDELNIKKMGGLHKKMKYTSILMSVASVALAGIYPFAGFFSKDKILEFAFSNGNYILWLALFVGAGLTAFYSFRLVMLVFFGEEKYKALGFHPHEAHSYVLFAMLPLGVLAVIAGWFEHGFESFVTALLPKAHFGISHFTAWILILATSAIALGGIFYAVYMYKKGGFPKWLEEKFCYKILINQYYIPQLYQNCIIRPYERLSEFAYKNIDEKIVDKSVDGIAKALYCFGDNANRLQSGNLSLMLRLMVIGLASLMTLAFVFSYFI